MNFIYLALLLVSLVCMAVIDKKYSLALFYDLRRTAITIISAVVLFVLWDIAGIMLGIFYSGESPYMSGIYLAPDFPVEELFFLTFLSYFTLVLFRFGEKKC